MEGNFGVAIRGNKASLILVENDGYSVTHYSCYEFGVENFEGCFSFSLNDQTYFCIKTTLWQLIKYKLTWRKLTYDGIKIIRYGTACVSLEQGTIIAGGCESGANHFPRPDVKVLRDSCVLIRKQGDSFVVNNVGRLPAKVKNHTLTKVSSNTFLMCGGIDSRGCETRDVYLGRLVQSTSANCYSVVWVKRVSMNECRSGHLAMFVNNRFHVFGGSNRYAYLEFEPSEPSVSELNENYNEVRKELQRRKTREELGILEEYHIINVWGIQSKYKRNCDQNIAFKNPYDNGFKKTEGVWIKRCMRYTIALASLVLSPDQKYGVIAGGRIYDAAIYVKQNARNIYIAKYMLKDHKNHTLLTINTSNLFMRALQDSDEKLHTGKLLKRILTFNWFTPMHNDIDNEVEDSRPPRRTSIM